MGIDHRRFDITMAEEFLDSADVVAHLKQMCAKGMPEGMAADVLYHPGIAHVSWKRAVGAITK